jgi:WD40 repeat protein
MPQGELPGSWLGRFKLAEEALEDGAFDEAVRCLEACLEIVPENPTTAYHLACAHTRAGRTEKAMAWLEHSIDWGWADAEVIRWDQDLEPLRGSEKFEELVTRVAAAKDAPEQSIRLAEPFWGLLSIESPTISADGERLLAMGNLWDVRTGELLAILSKGEHKVDHSFFDPSGEYIATVSESSVHLWNGRDGRFLQKVNEIVCTGIIGFSEDGLLFFHAEHPPGNQSDSSKELLYRVTVPLGDQSLGSYEGLFHPVLRRYGLAFRWDEWAVSPEGKRVITYSYKSAQLWNGETGELISSYPVNGIWEVGFSRDGLQAYILGNTEDVPMYKAPMGIQWIDTKDGSVLRHLKIKEDPKVKSCAFDSSGSLVAAYSSGIIRWWTVHEEEPFREMRLSSTDDVDTHDFHFRMDICMGGERLAVYSPSFFIPFRLLDLSTGAAIREWPEYFYIASFAGDYCFKSQRAGYHASGRFIKEIVRLDDGRTIQRLENSRLNLGWPKIMNDDDTVIVPTVDGSLRAFGLVSGKTNWILSGHSRSVEDVSLNPGGELLASTSVDGTVRIWDLGQQKEMSKLPAINPKYRQAAKIRWNPTGDRIATFLLAYEDRDAPEYSIRIWSVETGEALFEIPLHGGIHDLAWSPDNALLATAHDDGYARLWNAIDGTPVGSPLHHPESTTAVAFDPNGERLATGCYQENPSDSDMGREYMMPTIRLWDIASREVSDELPLSGDFIFDCRVPFMNWTSKGDLLVTTCDWPTVECFDGVSLKTRWFHTVAHGGAPWTIYALPNVQGDRVFVSGMSPDTARIIDADSGKELNIFGRDLSGIGYGFYNISGTTDNRYVIATCNNVATVVFDGQAFNELYRRLEHVDGSALLVTSHLVHRGNSSAIRKTSMIREEEAFPLDTFAPVLYDPKRFQAAAEGVTVRKPYLPSPPELTTLTPISRVATVDEDQAVVTVSASSQDGIIGFQLEKNGEVLPFGSEGTIERDPHGGAVLTWTIERPAAKETDLRIRAMGRSGMLSKPLLMTLQWK